jgi:hypothetical protein
LVYDGVREESAIVNSLTVCAFPWSEKGYGVRMLDVGASTIEQNVGAPTIALVDSGRRSMKKQKPSY